MTEGNGHSTASDESAERALSTLIKLLKMTTSSNEGEALTAARMANALLQRQHWDWERLLRGKVRIIADPFASAAGVPPPPPPSAARAAPSPAKPDPHPDRYGHRTGETPRIIGALASLNGRRLPSKLEARFRHIRDSWSKFGHLFANEFRDLMDMSGRASTFPKETPLDNL